MQNDSSDSATVVVTQIIIADREADYKHWQQRAIDAAREFDGFEGATMYPPSSDENREWVVVYRFATVEKLNVWAQSEIRRKLLNEGRAFFESPPTLEVLIGKPPPRDVLTAFASHDVLPGKEREFKQWQAKLTRAQEGFPGFMGSELFQPVVGIQDKWVSLFRYDSQTHLQGWLDSDDRAKLLREAHKFLRSFDLHTIRSPFSGWFGYGGAAGAAIPAWKQAMVVLLALFPIVVVLAYLAAVLDISGPMATFISLLLSTAVLTWILMPLLNRAFAFWLVPRGRKQTRTDLSGAAVVVLCYAVLLAVAGAVLG